MELLFAIVIGGGIGLVLRYLLPGREWHGLLVLPAIGLAATAVAWAVLLWLGLAFDGGWIWAISLTIGGAAALVAGLLLPGLRRRADAAAFEALRRA